MSFGANGVDMDTSTSNAEELAALLPEAHVIKAFNTLFASKQADPNLEGVTLDGFVAGDDAAAKATVLELVESMGLNPVDVGPLVRARQLESLAFLNIALQIANNGRLAVGLEARLRARHGPHGGLTDGRHRDGRIADCAREHPGQPPEPRRAVRP